MSSDPSFTAIIQLSDFQETPTRALNSIHECRSFFKQVFLVSAKNVVYDTQKFNYVTVVDVVKQDAIEAVAVLNIPPMCKFERSTLLKLWKKMRKSKFSEYTFGVHTVHNVSSSGFRLGSVFWYAMLLVSTVWDALHSRWERAKIYQTNDIVARTVYQKGGRTHISSLSAPWYARVYNPFFASAIYDTNAVIKPGRFDREYVLRHLCTHAHYGFSLWIFFYATLFLWTMMLLFAVFTMQFPVFVTLCIWVLAWSTVLLFANWHIKMPYLHGFALLFPLWLLLFPFAVLYSKFYVRKSAWE